jgi:hypothetical protein
MARVAVNTDLGGRELPQVMASPSAIVAPVAAVETPRVALLAQALADVNPALQQIIADQKVKFQTKEEERAYDRIQGLTYAEAKGLVDSGEIRRTESPFFDAAFQRQFGLVHAQQRQQEIATFYNTEFDKENGDLDAALAGYAKEDAELYGHSPHIMGGYRDGMKGTLPKVKANHADYTDKRLMEKAGDGFFALLKGGVTDAITNGGDPNAVVASLYKDHQTTLGMTPAEMDKMAMAAAQDAAAAGDYATVEAILSADPLGAGALKDRAEWSGAAIQTLEAAKQERGKNNRRNNIPSRVALEERAHAGTLTEEDRVAMRAWEADGQMTVDQIENLEMAHKGATEARTASTFDLTARDEILTAATEVLLRGEGAVIQDQTYTNPHTGKTKTVTRKEIVDAVVQEQMEQIIATEPEETRSAVMAHTLAKWGVEAEYAPWANAMSSGYVALSSTLAAAGEKGNIEVPPAAEIGFKTWKELADQPHLRERHVKDSRAADIYRDAEILEEAGAMSPKEALLVSAQIDRENPRTSLSSGVSKDAYAAAVESAIDTGWFGETALDSTYVGGAIERHARVLMDTGMGMEAAVNAAAKSFSAGHTFINGIAVNTRDNYIPPDFSDLSTGYLDEVATGLGESPSDLTLIPMGGSQKMWRVVYRDSFAPVPGTGPVKVGDIKPANLPPPVNMMDEANKNRDPWTDFDAWKRLTRPQRRALGLPTTGLGWSWMQKSPGTHTPPPET